MIENTEIPFEVSSNENMPDDIPLGNYAPLISPPTLGQSFLQPKFIYPLGAVSLFNPDNAEINDGFESLNNSFDGSPFFNQPLSPTSLPMVDGQTINQSNIQAKSLSSQNNLQRKQQNSLSSSTSNDKSTQRQPLNNSPASQTNGIQRQPDISPIDSISQGDLNIQQELSFPPVDNITQSVQSDVQEQFESLSIDNISQSEQNIQQVQRFSESPVLENISQSDRTIQDSASNISQTPQIDAIQRQSDISAVSDISQDDQNIQRFSELPVLDNASQGDRTIQREIDSPTADISRSPQIDTIQRQSDISGVDIIPQGDQNIQQVQRFSESPILDDVLQGDAPQKVLRFSESPVLENVSQRDRTVQKSNSNIIQTPQTDSIQRESDISTVGYITQDEQSIQQVQRSSESPVLDSGSQSDRTIQRETDFITDNISQTPQIDAIQRQSDISAISDIPQSDAPQKVQRFSESSVLDDVSQGDRTIQREADFTTADISQPSQIDSIQRQSDISAIDGISQGDLNIQQVQRFSESPALDNALQGDRTLQDSDSNITQTPQIDAIQRESDISAVSDISQGNQNIQRFSELSALDDVSQGDRTIQREADFTTVDISQPSQIDAIQRQSDISAIDGISQGDLNIQQVQRFSESPVLDSVSQDDRTIQESDSNIIQTPQIDAIQRESDNSAIDDIAQSSDTQQVQRFSESSILDNVSQSDRTLQNSDSNITQTPQIDSIQRESDISAVSDISQVEQNIQRFAGSPVLDDLSQGDRTTQRETNSNITQTTQTDSLQKQPDILAVSDILQGDHSQSIQRKVEANNQENPIDNSENKTIIQMMRDPSNTADLKLPKAIENLSQTEYLGNFSPLTPSKTTSSKSSQTVQRSQIDRPSPNSLSNSLNNLPQIIQPKQDQNPDSNHTNSTGWSNIAELLANLPPPKSSSNSPASSLNNQKTSDRSPLATKPASVSSTSNQTTIQRSLDQNDTDSDQDLYITPTGIQKGNPNKIITTQSNTVQRKINAEQLPEATVSVEPRQDQNQDDENFDQNLETLAQEIYILLKKRLETEKERQGTRYQGRLPW